jgi:hypothetical protein
MSWLIAILFSLFIIVLYLHVYLHFRVSPDNRYEHLTDVCRKNITDMIYYKSPFTFKCLSMVKDIDINQGKKASQKECSVYKMVYSPTPLLEPTVKFFPSTSVYKFQKPERHCDLEMNLECRNFYIVQQGSVEITCIHPKYSDHFTSKTKFDFIKSNTQLLRIKLEQGDALFVPNYWRIVIESTEKDTLVEVIRYSTILNQFNFMYDKYVPKLI